MFVMVDVCLLVFIKQLAAVQRHTVSSSAMGRTDRAQLSSDNESSSVTGDSDADVISANKWNSHSSTTRSALECFWKLLLRELWPSFICLSWHYYQNNLPTNNADSSVDRLGLNSRIAECSSRSYCYLEHFFVGLLWWLMLFLWLCTGLCCMLINCDPSLYVSINLPFFWVYY